MIMKEQTPANIKIEPPATKQLMLMTSSWQKECMFLDLAVPLAQQRSQQVKTHRTLAQRSPTE
jgi:hypothetical protein